MFQTNIKRLFGYSSISHAGYLLMGAAAGSVLGVSAMNLYLLGYLFANLAAFTVIVFVSLTTKSESIDDFAGLSKRSCFLGTTMLLALVSLAGMPPLAGFFGKFALLLSVIQSGYLWLALIAAVNIVISLFYYLRVAKIVFVHEPSTPDLIVVSTTMKWILGFALAGIIGMGIFQGPFLDAAITAAR